MITTANDGTSIDYDTILNLFDNSGVSITSNNNFGGSTYSQIEAFLPAGSYQFLVVTSAGLVVPSYSVSLTVMPVENTELPPLIVDSVDMNQYGFSFEGINSHREALERQFDASGTDLLLTVTGYDIDIVR